MEENIFFSYFLQGDYYESKIGLQATMMCSIFTKRCSDAKKKEKKKKEMKMLQAASPQCNPAKAKALYSINCRTHIYRESTHKRLI